MSVVWIFASREFAAQVEIPLGFPVEGWTRFIHLAPKGFLAAPTHDRLMAGRNSGSVMLLQGICNNFSTVISMVLESPKASHFFTSPKSIAAIDCPLGCGTVGRTSFYGPRKPRQSRGTLVVQVDNLTFWTCLGLEALVNTNLPFCSQFAHCTLPTRRRSK